MSVHEISRDYYGHDETAINKHSERVFTDSSGRLFKLSRTTDGVPPFFEAYGPYTEDYRGILPRLLVDGREYWGDGWTWGRALEAFRQAVAKVQS
jgi:hypothetical protein